MPRYVAMNPTDELLAFTSSTVAVRLGSTIFTYADDMTIYAKAGSRVVRSGTDR